MATNNQPMLAAKSPVAVAGKKRQGMPKWLRIVVGTVLFLFVAAFGVVVFRYYNNVPWSMDQYFPGGPHTGHNVWDITAKQKM